MVVSRKSWHYRLLVEFSSDKFLTDLAMGQVKPSEYKKHVALHALLVFISTAGLLSLGVAFGTFIVAEVLEIHGEVYALGLAIGMILTTALMVVALESLRVISLIPQTRPRAIPTKTSARDFLVWEVSTGVGEVNKDRVNIRS